MVGLYLRNVLALTSEPVVNSSREKNRFLGSVTCEATMSCDYDKVNVARAQWRGETTLGTSGATMSCDYDNICHCSMA